MAGRRPPAGATLARVAKRWHPDRPGDGPETARRTAEINAAYDTLRGRGEGERAVPPRRRTGAPAAARSRRPGHRLPESVRRSLGGELLAALDEDTGRARQSRGDVQEPAPSSRSTDRRLLWLLDDAISHRVHALRWRDVVRVEHRLRRPLRRTAVLRVETKLGRRLEWAELRPETAAAAARHVAAGAGL